VGLLDLFSGITKDLNLMDNNPFWHFGASLTFSVIINTKYLIVNIERG